MSSERSSWPAGLGVGIGFVVAVLAYLPLTFILRARLGIAPPDLRPPQAPSWGEASTAYWASWPVSLAALAAPGLLAMAAALPETRRMGAAYAITALVVGTGMCGFGLFWDFGGFAPVPS